MSDRKSDHDKLWDLIKDIKFGLLVHRHPNGMLHSHPLTTQNKSIDEGSTLWFFIGKDSELYTNVQADGNVNVSYANPEKDSYVSLSGQASISSDRAKKEELFGTLTKAWFPGGVDDPNLALLAVRLNHAEYWEAKEGQTKQLIKMALAAISGEKVHLKAEHKELVV